MVDVPPTLPAQVYLLAYDPVRGRLTASGHLGYVLRGAALAELLAGGHLTDVGGRPRVDAVLRSPADPVLAQVLGEIARARPRSWSHWVGHRVGATKRAVTERMVADGWIELSRRRVLGLVPWTTVTVRRPRAVTALAERVRRALAGSTPVSKVDPSDAMLVALASAGELATVLPRATRKEHKDRIAALIETSGPVAPAVRKAIQWANAAAAGA